MQSYTIRSLKQERFKNKLTGVYVIRDGDIIFYVGQTHYFVVERLYEHMGRGDRYQPSPSLIGQYIRMNSPSSDDWQIEIYTFEECEHIVFDFDNNYKNWIEHADRNEVLEAALIARLHPYINKQDNRYERPLPDKYKRPHKPY